ncbi:hypothetical protein HMPREF2746_02930 [Pseudomonas aeruginosa]|nr:hypothetical protein HMPREF2746_02930 [Pseudomonas aeruginosa]
MLDYYAINFYFKSIFYEEGVISADICSQLFNEKIVSKFGAYTFFEICYVNLGSNEIWLSKLF